MQPDENPFAQYESDPFGSFVGDASTRWGKLEEPPSATEPVPTLPDHMVPGPFREWLMDVAERVSIPPEFVVIPAIVALGAVAGRRVGIRPERFDDFTVVPNLWGAIVGRPGAMKSAAVSEALAPLQRIAAIAITEHNELMGEWRIRKVELEGELAAIKGRLKRAGEHDDRERLAEVLNELEDGEPVARRYVTQDATVEKLGEMLQANPNGILVARDELSGWLRSLDKAGREGDREFYLEAWNGTGGYTFDRIGRGSVHIPAVCVGVVGGLQPGKLRQYVAGAIDGGWGDDGLLQRLQLFVWPDSMGEWRQVQRWPNSEAKATAFRVFNDLASLNPNYLDVHVDEYATNPIPFLRFHPEGQEVFDAWRRELETRLRGDEFADTPAFESHLSKYRSLMPSIALLFHLVDVVTGDNDGLVSRESAVQAAEWCEFLEAHARKLYAGELRRDFGVAHLLAEKIRDGAIAHGDTLRSVHRNEWRGLGDADQVRTGCRVLERANWLRVVREETGGRPTEVIHLHPELRGDGDA